MIIHRTVKASDPPARLRASFPHADGSMGLPDDIPLWRSSDPTVVDISSVTINGNEAQLVWGRSGIATVVVVSRRLDGARHYGVFRISVEPVGPPQIEFDFRP